VVDYAALRTTTKTLIDGAGRSVTVRKLGNSPSSDDQMPWRTDTRPVLASVTGAGVFATDHTRGGVSWSILRGVLEGMSTDNAVVLFAAANDGGEDLEGFHEIVDGDRTWQIMRTELLQPGTERLLYAFEVMG
jgi:hypothetical protein